MEVETKPSMPHMGKDGTYDMMRILKADLEDRKRTLFEFPDYVGSVTVKNLQGKCRGVIATELYFVQKSLTINDIQPGELISVAKAIAIVFPDDKGPGATSKHEVEKMGLLREAVAKVVRNDREKASIVYNMYAGPELGYLSLKSDHPEGKVDMERIERICALNGFTGDSRNEFGETYYGLWYFPALINHDCYRSNAHWRVFKNVMFVRATKFIPEGQEVLVTYFDPNQLYFERKRLFIKHEFQCDCLLCDLERGETHKVRRKRDSILTQFKNEAHSISINSIELYIKELESLRPQNPELNVFLIQPLVQLGFCYYGKNDYTKAGDAFEKAFELCKLSAQLNQIGLSCALMLTSTYLHLKKPTNMIQKWFDIALSAAVIQFGTAQILRYIRPTFVEEMEKVGFKLN